MKSVNMSFLTLSQTTARCKTAPVDPAQVVSTREAQLILYIAVYMEEKFRK